VVREIEAMGRKAVAFQLNTGDTSAFDGFASGVRKTLQQWGRERFDFLVNNAGHSLHVPLMDVTEAQFDEMVDAKGAFFTLQQAARHIADNGRIVYVGSSTTAFPTPGHGLYSGSKIAAQLLVEVLAKEIGTRGVTVNSILPTAIEGAGVYTEGASEQVMQFVRSFRPIQRMGTLDDVANAAEYLASDLAGFISGQHLLVSGGAPA
jgi:3-oxoacyl-[acyl-carrier protein] reductase